MEFTIQNSLAVFGAVVTLVTIIGTLVSIPKILTYWPAFKKYTPLLLSLVSRDIKVKYRRSVIGVVWSVLNPLLMMLIMTLVFSTIFNRIDNFAVYYITGVLIYSFISDATNSSLTSVIRAASLIKKTYIPKYIFPLQKCLFAVVNMGFSLIAVVIVYIFLRVELHPTILLFFVPLLYAAVFSLGLALILSAADVFLRDVGHIWQVWNTAWMYLTPIIYPIDILPGFLQKILQFNPLLHFVNYARDVMMYGVLPGLSENLICLGFSLSTLLVGLYVFKKNQDRFILYI